MAKLSKKDIKRKTEAYKKKVDEYNLMSLEDLKKLYETKKPGGIYHEALVRVVEYKLQQERMLQMKELTDTSREQNNKVLSEQ